MQADSARIWGLLVSALMALVIYRRLTRTFGRQPVRPARMTVRVGLLIALGVSLIPRALDSGVLLCAEIVGAGSGTALALWAANRTRFMRIAGQLYYVPHTHSGIAISALVLGRIVYRFVEMHSGSREADTALSSPPGFAPSLAVQCGPIGQLFQACEPLLIAFPQ